MCVPSFVSVQRASPRCVCVSVCSVCSYYCCSSLSHLWLLVLKRSLMSERIILALITWCSFHINISFHRMGCALVVFAAVKPVRSAVKCCFSRAFCCVCIYRSESPHPPSSVCRTWSSVALVLQSITTYCGGGLCSQISDSPCQDRYLQCLFCLHLSATPTLQPLFTSVVTVFLLLLSLLPCFCCRGHAVFSADIVQHRFPGVFSRCWDWSNFLDLRITGVECNPLI